VSKRLLILLFGVAGVAALALGGFWYSHGGPSKTDPVPVTVAPVTGQNTGPDRIRVESPSVNSIVSSPLTVRGEARGNWYFEASFPVKLYDANGNELVATPAQAQGDWMTTEFVPFSATLEFRTPQTDTGTLVFKKDNPSGLPEYDDQFVVPVMFR